MPHSSIVRIIERIEPSYMKHILGVMHAQRLLLTDNDCIISILIQFINNSQWEKYPKDDNQIILAERLFPKPKKIKKVLNYLIKKCTSWTHESTSENRKYGKINLELLQNESEPSINHVIHTLYITLEAYIDTYDIHCVKETWDKLNEEALNHSSSQTKQEYGSYTVTEHIIKKYKSILKDINELHLAFQNLKSVGVPEPLCIFENAGLL